MAEVDFRAGLRAVVRRSACGWVELTPADVRVLEALQEGTVEECARFLVVRGCFDAAEELRAALGGGGDVARGK